MDKKIISYVIKVNNEVAATKQSLKDARQHIKAMPILNDTDTISIVKQVVSELVVNTYQPKVSKTWTVADMDLE